LPGKPDVVFVAAKVAVFCDGDFWHGRHWQDLRERLRRGANGTYWIAKIHANRKRDKRVNIELRNTGWRVMRLWEGDILTNPDRAARKICQAVVSRLRSHASCE
jgi:DNA mismatch endonuclease (patch repair protein)